VIEKEVIKRISSPIPYLKATFTLATATSFVADSIFTVAETLEPLDHNHTAGATPNAKPSNTGIENPAAKLIMVAKPKLPK
jgi:hypothetical protein